MPALQVTQYFMNFSGEGGLPEGEEERQEKLNDMLDDAQVPLHSCFNYCVLQFSA